MDREHPGQPAETPSLPLPSPRPVCVSRPLPVPVTTRHFIFICFIFFPFFFFFFLFFLLCFVFLPAIPSCLLRQKKTTQTKKQKTTQKKTIVRGTKAAKDGSLSWLLDEFENMSVSRSNSLRRDSPPFPPRRDHLYQENGLSEGPPAARPHDARGKDKKLHGARGELEQGKERPRDGEEQRAHHPQQPRGQEPGPKGAGGRPPPPEYPRPPDRDCGEPVVRRERPEPCERRPKSTYAADSSPQPPRDKRPLSGPNMRTPNIPVSEGVMKTAQQTGRPFNTYPRADTDPGRGAGSQVKAPPLPLSAQSLAEISPPPAGVVFLFLFFFFLFLLALPALLLLQKQPPLSSAS